MENSPFARPVRRTIYAGAFAHCPALGELDICEHGAIGVDEDGVIAFVERDIKADGIEELKSGKGADWKESEVVKAKGSGFFFPGFIGEWEFLNRGEWRREHFDRLSEEAGDLSHHERRRT